MSRNMRRSVLVFLTAGAGIVSLMVSLSGQSSPPGKPSTARGEWPTYTADNNGTRYSPLDQINASNFNKLEVAWRFKTDSLGPRPEYQFESTPLMVHGRLYTTAGSRRADHRDVQCGRYERAKQRRNRVSQQTCWRVVAHVYLHAGSAVFFRLKMYNAVVLNG